MEIVLGYLAGLLTLINPCVLPVLPIVLASALQASKYGPMALAAGLSISFVFFGISVAAFGRSFGLNETMVVQAAAFLMIAFGLVLVIPYFNTAFSTATAGISAGADIRMDSLNNKSLKGQFLGGVFLGAVWSPCVGPTLGGAISLAYQGQNLLQATAIMTSFALGISTIILLLGYGAQSVLKKRRDLMRRIAEKSKTIMGMVFIVVGVAILFDLQQIIEGWLVQNLPAWFIDFSVKI